MMNPKVRTIIELLNILLKYKQHFNHGLCYTAYKLQWSKITTVKETIILIDYIRDNRPKPSSKCSSIINYARETGEHYYWHYSDIIPRITWVKRRLLIEKKLLNK